MIVKFLSAYLCNYPKVLAYMWQSSEYERVAFLAWWKRTRDFQKVSYRGDLVKTRSSRLVYLMCVGAVIFHILLNALIIYLIRDNLVFGALATIIAIALYPMAMIFYTSVPIALYRRIVFTPSQNKLIARARQKFESTGAIVVAVAGSYGKTTMKEMLAHLLGSERKIAYTEGNKNVLVSQAKFGLSLNGDEEILIVEFGEGSPGDVVAMSNLVEPDYAIVTGLAPNHLDKYESIDAVAKDFESLIKHVGPERAFINGDSLELLKRFEVDAKVYDQTGFDGWKVGKITVNVDSTEFTLKKGGKSYSFKTGLVGRHNVGPVCVAVCLAMDMDVSVASIQKALASITPYEHRLEPKPFSGGWLVDDAYNGNIDGIIAGLNYLAEIKVNGKKIYVTSGLVDQGAMTEIVHKKIGEKIAEANPDKVYLVNNSVAEIMRESAVQAGYEGAVTLIEKPLEFYRSIESIMAHGDVVLIQNDWPDNYA